LKIRRSTQLDKKQLAQLRRLFFEEDHLFTEAEKRRFEEETQRFLTEHLDDTLISWHAEQEGEIVAVAFLEIAERLPHPARKHGKIGTVLNVYTKPAFRKQGLASQLVKELTKEAARLQLDKVELLATALGYPVYQKIGFSEVILSDRFMEKKLD
jgi:predicted GNAT family acetyltransferase